MEFVDSHVCLGGVSLTLQALLLRFWVRFDFIVSTGRRCGKKCLLGMGDLWACGRSGYSFVGVVERGLLFICGLGWMREMGRVGGCMIGFGVIVTDIKEGRWDGIKRTYAVGSSLSLMIICSCRCWLGICFRGISSELCFLSIPIQGWGADSSPMGR